MQPPPSRYKVVEQERRLVVIDTLTGKPATRGSPPPTEGDATSPPAVARRIVDNRGGRPVIATLALYDLNGPRDIVLSEETQRTLTAAGMGAAILAVMWLMIAFTWPIAAFVALFVVFQPKSVTAIRQWITTQLDRSV